MSFETFVSSRLRLGNSDGKKSSPAVAIAVSGIALAVAVMMLSVAVVFGFKNEIKGKVMGFDAQITVAPMSYYYSGEEGYTPLTLDENLSDIVDRCVPGATKALSLRQPAVIKTDDDFLGVVFRGYGKGHDSSYEKGNLVEGELPDSANRITVSESMASKLSLKTGDKVYAYFFTGESLKTRRFEVAGIYRSNFGEYDDVVAYASIDDLQSLNHFSDSEGELLEIRGVEEGRIKECASALQVELNRAYAEGRLPEGMVVDTVIHTGAAYFNWLDLLDTNVVVILVLMGFVSGFTLISCVFILILERVRMIGLLKALGASGRQIRNIFMFLGGRVVLWGLLIGNVVSLGLVLLEWKFRFIPLDPEAYYLTFVPVEVTLWQVLLLNAGVVAVSAMLMLIPTAIISRISPSATMHYE